MPRVYRAAVEEKVLGMGEFQPPSVGEKGRGEQRVGKQGSETGYNRREESGAE